MNLLSNAIKFTRAIGGMPGGKVSVSVAHRRISFISKELAERYFRKKPCHMMEDELPQEEDMENVYERCGNAVLGKRENVRGDKEECVVEEVCWNQGSNMSQKMKKERRIIKGRGGVERPELQMAAWKGETKYFHLESNDDDVVQDEKGDEETRRREKEKCEDENRDEYDYVHIMVKDSGRGIPANLLATIFDPFVQV